MGRMGRIVRRRRRKRCSNRKHKQPSSSLSCLPQELITDIIAHVAAFSFTDFLTTKLVCKDFCKLPEQEEGYIYRHVSLKNFPIVAWRNIEKHSEFLKKCHQNRNPEALYRQGVVHYFGRASLDCAINCLKEAAKSGHMGACYAMGIIFVFGGGELKQKGMVLLSGMKKSKILRKKVKAYRESLQTIIRMIWKSPSIVKETPSCCTMQHREKRSGWVVDEIDEDEIMCEACASDLEIASICNIL